MSSELSAATYQPLVASTFAARGADLAETVELKLLSVTEHARNDTLQTFALLLGGPAEPILNQGIYTLHHNQTGTAELFLSPVGRDANGYLYEIIFNQFVTPGTELGVTREATHE